MLDKPDTTEGLSAAPPVPALVNPPHPIASLQYWIDRFGAAQVGIVLMVGGCGLLTVGDATAKWLTATHPLGEVISLRGFIIAAFILAIYRGAARRQLWPRYPTAQFVRAFLFVTATFLMVWSFKLLPLATVSAIAFASPLVITVLAPVVLREHVGIRRYLATIVGFVGILVIIDPRDAGASWIMLVPVAAVVCGALRDLATRYIAGTETAASVLFISISATALAGAFTLPFGWTMPSAFDALLLLLLAAAHGLSYLMQFLAYRAAEAGLLAPFKYTLLLWAILFGFLVWGHLPSLSILLGASIVIAAGLYVWHRETRAEART